MSFATPLSSCRESSVDVSVRLNRINKLIEERKFETAEYWESMDEILDRREIDLTFGSTGYEYRVPRDNGRLSSVNDNGDLYTIFLHGYCPLFAFAAHERTGLNFRVFSDPGATHGWSGHVGLDLGDEDFLDITGVRKIADYAVEAPLLTTHVISRAEFLETLMGEGYRTNPLAYVEELEQLLTEQAAHEVLTAAHLI